MNLTGYTDDGWKMLSLKRVNFTGNLTKDLIN